jgi:hypothetical protein
VEPQDVAEDENGHLTRRQDLEGADEGSTLAELANTAFFMASDQGSGLTGTTVNLTMGNLDD